MTSNTLKALFAIAGFSLFAACDAPREADPYSARLAVEKPAYNRASAPKVAVVVDSGVAPQFTDSQATAGATVYASTCGRCHAAAQWTGGTFAATWNGRRVSDFYDLIAATMPQDAPASLTAEQYLEVTAYVLQLGGLPGGNIALSTDTAAIRHMRIRVAPPASKPAG